MEVREIVATIGDISVGKSSFINFLIGKKLLQSGSKLTTRFLLFIRNSNIDKPRFLHIQRESTTGGKFGKGIYEILEVLVDGPNSNESEDIINEKIRNEITKINSSLIEVQKNEDTHDYSKLLYMLQINIKNVNNDFFKDSYDLADIPGLGSISKKEKENLFKKDENIEFDPYQDIRDIFFVIRDLVSTGFLIFSALSFEDDEEIIEELMKKEKIKFRNFLIILNKIDCVKDKDKKLEKLKAISFINFKDELLSGTNTILGLSCKRLLEECLAMNTFSDFLFYYFTEYLLSEEQIKITDYLKSILSRGYYERNKGKEGLKNYQKLSEILDPEEEIDEEVKNITNQSLGLANDYLGISKKIDLELEDTLNDDCIENIKVINCLYKAFNQKEKYFYHEPSEYKKQIDTFFASFKPLESNIIQTDISHLKSRGNSKLRKSIQKIRDFFSTQIYPFGKDQVNIKILDKNIRGVEHLINNCDKVRITFYGTYNAGKSSVINSFIGYEILESRDEECTFKPILIKYYDDDTPRLYRGKMSKIEDYLSESHENYDAIGEPIAVGEERIKDYIKLQNYLGNTGKDCGTETYILYTRIKILDEMDLPLEIKENVEFVDTPGITKRKIKDFGPEYKSLINNTVIYVIVIDMTRGGEENKKVYMELESIINSAKGRLKDNTRGFPAYCLFIFNKCDMNDSNNPSNSKDRDNTLVELLEEKNEKVTICNYSALKRLEMILKENYYSPKKYQSRLYEQYKKNIFRIRANFIGFMETQIKKDIKDNFSKQFQDQLPDQEIVDTLRGELIEQNFATREEAEKDIKKIENISKYLSFALKNIGNLKISVSSEYDNLKYNLEKKIKFGYSILEKNYKSNIIELTNYINDFFHKGTLPMSMSTMNTMNPANPANRSVPSNNMADHDKIQNAIDEIFIKNDINTVLRQCEKDVITELELKHESYKNYEELFKSKKEFIAKRLEKLEKNDIPDFIMSIKKELIERAKSGELKFLLEINYISEKNEFYEKSKEIEARSLVKEYAQIGGMGVGWLVSGLLGAPYEIMKAQAWVVQWI